LHINLIGKKLLRFLVLISV